MSTKCMYRVTAKALIKNEQKKLLLAEEKGGGGFELPGGGIELGETPQTALIRELKEELNLAPNYIAESPTFIWFINGEVVWLVYEVKVDQNPKVESQEHIASAGYFDIEELLGKKSHGLGYCCTMHFEKLQKYLD